MKTFGITWSNRKSKYTYICGTRNGNGIAKNLFDTMRKQKRMKNNHKKYFLISFICSMQRWLCTIVRSFIFRIWTREVNFGGPLWFESSSFENGSSGCTRFSLIQTLGPLPEIGAVKSTFSEPEVGNGTSWERNFFSRTKPKLSDQGISGQNEQKRTPSLMVSAWFWIKSSGPILS